MRREDNRHRPPTNPDVARFDQWATTYERSLMQGFFFVPVHSKMLGILDEQARPEAPSVIVDIGCGTGRLLRAAALRWPKARLFGVDPAEQMVSQARHLNSNASFSIASAESLPFPDQAADIVFTSMSFHHWADQERGVHEVARVLRPGGFFCLADHAFLPARLLGEKVRSRNEIRALLSGAGIAVRHQQATVLFVLFTLGQKL